MASLSIFLNKSPFVFDSHIQAMSYIRQVAASREIQRVFFYQDAVLAGLMHQTPVQGQPSIAEQWRTLAQEFNFPLQLCIANALRRGVFNQEEAKRYGASANLTDGFQLCGLGEMADAVANSDRIVQF